MKKMENVQMELVTMKAKTEHLLDETKKLVNDTLGEMIKESGIDGFFNLDSREFMLMKRGLDLYNLAAELFTDYAIIADKMVAQEVKIAEQNDKIDRLTEMSRDQADLLNTIYQEVSKSSTSRNTKPKKATIKNAFEDDDDDSIMLD